MPSVNIRINGREIAADNSQTILQVARANGVQIPTLCYDPRLPPYGSCLVCVVEVRSANRLLMSCTTPVAEGMDIWTESEPAMKARRAALEMLLSNHYADCRGPCFLQCPANVDVQGYLAFANAGMYREALELIRETNPMPLACGRVCVRYCEASCRRNDVDSPAAINFMKRYVADLEYDNLPQPAAISKTGKKVAIIGGGPAGLTCGYFLAVKGHAVTIFDKQPKLGGMLRYGIPEYRLPEAVLDKEISYLLAHGIEARTNVRLGHDVRLDDLKRQGFDAIYIALGSWIAKGMGIENETHPNILSGIAFLEGVKRNGPPALHGTVAVLGGGNTAIDASRTALRCGAEKVAILYRRSENEMPADEVEVKDARDEGVDIRFLVAPKRAVVEGGRLVGLECFRMELGEPDTSGRRRPVQVKGSEFLFACDWAISAIGQDPDLQGLENATLGPIAVTKWKSIQADPETFQTTVPGVFAGGDAMTGPQAAIDAIGGARKAAWVIDRYLATGKVEKFQAAFVSKRTALAPLDASFFAQFEKSARESMPKLDGQERTRHWDEVDLGVNAAQVRHETSRCLSCGCASVFDCDLKVLSGNYDARQEHYTGRIKKHKLDDRHPYILLDSNKCILCGRCVRYCGDLIGVHALGFINRGYETVVKPALDKPLRETTCVTCGNCIEVCPTGAITFKANLDKPGPFRTTPARSVCSFCGVGCELDVNHTGRDYFFVTAKPADQYTEGELCAKGRFGTYYVGSRERLYACAVKGRGQVGMPEAARALHAGLARIRERHGADAILFLASPRLSTEAAWLFASLARRYGSSFVFPAEDLRRAALPDVRNLSGHNISTAKQDDVLGARTVVVTVGQDVCTYNPVFGWKVRRAPQNGATWVHVGPVPAAWRRLVHVHVDCPAGEEAAALSAMCGIIAAKGLHDAESLAAVANAQAFLSHGFARPTRGAAEAAGLVADASKKVVIVINQDAAVGSDHADLRWAADLALLTGRTGGGKGGLLVVKNDANGQGVQDAFYDGGFATGADLARAKAQLRSGKIKALVLLGVDPMGLADLDADLARAEFTAAIDVFPSAATERADVVVPLTPLQEEDGSVVSFDGRIASFKKVFKPLAGFNSIEFLAEALAQVGGDRPDLAATRQAIASALPLYRSLASGTPTGYLCDEAARHPRALAFAMAPVSSGPISGTYHSATTFSRVAEATVRASLAGNPVAALCETR
jgi:formate dehydrogenase major subunit